MWLFRRTDQYEGSTTPRLASPPARRCRRAPPRRWLRSAAPACRCASGRPGRRGRPGPSRRRHGKRTLEVAVEPEPRRRARARSARRPRSHSGFDPRARPAEPSSLITQTQLRWLCSRIESSWRFRSSGGGSKLAMQIATRGPVAPEGKAGEGSPGGSAPVRARADPTTASLSPAPAMRARSTTSACPAEIEPGTRAIPTNPLR